MDPGLYIQKKFGEKESFKFSFMLAYYYFIPTKELISKREFLNIYEKSFKLGFVADNFTLICTAIVLAWFCDEIRSNKAYWNKKY